MRTPLSSRRVGANEQVTTYGTGETYSALSTWEAATDTDHVSDEETDVLECVDTDSSFDDIVSIGDSTNNSTFFRIVRAQDGSAHDGTSNNGVHFLYTSTGHGPFLLAESDIHLQDLILTHTLNSVDERYAVYAFSNGTHYLVGLIVVDSTNSGSGNVDQLRLNVSSVMVNCVSHNAERSGVVGTAATSTVYNCTSEGNAVYGFRLTGASTVMKAINCIGDNNTSGDFSNTGGALFTGSDYCVDSDGSDPASGTNNRNSQSMTYRNSGSDDFELASADHNSAAAFGTDLSRDATFAFDDDIVGVERGRSGHAWDIGAYAFHYSSRRTGRNEDIATYGTGYTYTTLSAYEIATDVDHAGTTFDTDVLECYDTDASFDDELNAADSTNDASYHRIVRSATGQGHNGTPTSGVFFDSQAAGASTFNLNESWTSLQDIIVSADNNSASNFSCLITQSAVSNNVIAAVIIFDSANSGSGVQRGFQTVSTTSIMVNCLCHNTDQRGYLMTGGTAYNCTTVSQPDRGFFASSGSPLVKNCLSTDNGATAWDFWSTFSASSDYNAEEGTSSPGGGANNRTSQSFTFRNYSSDNFHLDPSDAGARRFGTDLSTDTTFAFDDDIDRLPVVSPAWDIGMDNDPVGGVFGFGLRRVGRRRERRRRG